MNGIKLKKSFVFTVSFFVFSFFLGLHLSAAEESEIYIVSQQDSRFEYTGLSSGGVKIRATEGTALIGSVSLPASLDGQNVTAISERGFIGQKLITELVIPESVTSIGGSAFSNCLSLSKVSIEGKLTDVGIYPFYASPFENGLEKKGNFVILNGDILYDYTGASSDIKIPEGIRVISGNLFTYFEAQRDFDIKYVTFPDSVEYICSGAFFDCNNIVDITLGTGVADIGINAFTSSGMTVSGYYETYAQTYASDHGYKFVPLVPYGEIGETLYTDFEKGFRQYYFSDEESFSRDGVFVYRRNYNGEKVEVTDWTYSSTPKELYKSNN